MGIAEFAVAVAAVVVFAFDVALVVAVTVAADVAVGVVAKCVLNKENPNFISGRGTLLPV